MSGDPGVGAGRAGRCTRLPASERACAAARPAPGGRGVRVGEVPHQASGLVRAFPLAAPQSPLSRGRGKVTGKFGALEESCASGEPSGGEAPEESVRRSLFGRGDPGKISERAPPAACRSAPTCAPPAKLRGLTSRGGGGGGRATAGSGPLAAEGSPLGTGAASLLGDAVESGLPQPPRLPRSPATVFGLGRGRARVGQG